MRFLDFSKIEAGGVQLEKADFDLAQVVEEQISLIGVLAHEKNLRLETCIDSRACRGRLAATAEKSVKFYLIF